MKRKRKSLENSPTYGTVAGVQRRRSSCVEITFLWTVFGICFLAEWPRSFRMDSLKRMREKKENLPKYCTMSLIPDFIVIPFSSFLWAADFITFCVSVLAKRWHTRTSWVEAGASRYTGSMLIWIRIPPDLLSSFLEASFPYYSSDIHLRFRLRSASIRSPNHGLWLWNQILSQRGYGKY